MQDALSFNKIIMQILGIIAVPGLDLKLCDVGTNKEVVTLRLSLSRIDGYLERANKVYEFFKDYSLNSIDFSKKKMIIFDVLNEKRMIFINDISTDRLNNYGISVLFESLKLESTQLINLNLSSNKLCDHQAITLAEALVHNKSLKILQLRNNEIADRGAKAISIMIKLNRKLKVLDLSKNRISAGGLNLVSKAILFNKAIEMIDLRDPVMNLIRVKPALKLARFKQSALQIKIV